MYALLVLLVYFCLPVSSERSGNNLISGGYYFADDLDYFACPVKNNSGCQCELEFGEPRLLILCFDRQHSSLFPPLQADEQPSALAIEFYDTAGLEVLSSNGMNGIQRPKIAFYYNSDLRRISSHAFNFTKADQIHFIGNRNLSNIENYAFHGWKKLSESAEQQLLLMDLPRIELTAKQLIGVPQLKVLIVEGRAGPLVIKGNLFEFSLSNLRRLELHGVISGVDNRTFKSAVNLIELAVLNSNYQPQAGHFRGLVSLKRLELIGLDIARLDDNLFQLVNPELAELSLAGNGLTELPCSIRTFSQLRLLNLSDNAFASIPARLALLTSVDHVDLSRTASYQRFECECQILWIQRWLPYRRYGDSLFYTTKSKFMELNCPHIFQGATCALEHCLTHLRSLCEQRYRTSSLDPGCAAVYASEPTRHSTFVLANATARLSAVAWLLCLASFLSPLHGIREQI